MEEKKGYRMELHGKGWNSMEEKKCYRMELGACTYAKDGLEWWQFNETL